MLIYDGNRPISSIRFSFMFPATSDVLNEKDFAKVKNSDFQYYNLLLKEYIFCTKNEEQIHRKALSVYKMGCDKNHPFNYTCCDFKLLESKYLSFES